MSIKPFFILLVFWGANNLFGQNNIQYNVLVESNDTSWYLTYEKISFDAKSKRVVNHTADQDSFLVWLIKDIGVMPIEKRNILWYVHGMWGGQRNNFRRAYKLMNHHLLSNNESNIGQMVSLKWPGNDFDYKQNKKRLYNLAPILEQQFIPLVQRMHVASYFSLGQSMDIDLLAHSLGNELVKEILLSSTYVMRDEPGLFRELLWTASDLSSDIFEDKNVMDRISRSAERHHFYFSERDLTLEVSHKLNKQDRLGRSGPTEASYSADNFYYIDVTLIKDEVNFPDLISGHSYYRASPIVTDDIIAVLQGHNPNKINNRIAKNSRQHHFVLAPVSETD